MSAQTDRLTKRLSAIPKSVREGVTPALVKSADEIAGRMRTLAPEATGELKKSIAVTGPGQSTPAYSQPGGSQVAGENEVLITAGDTDVRYPHLVEYGTKDAQAQPFFFVSYRLGKKRAAGRVKRAISKAVKSEWGK